MQKFILTTERIGLRETRPEDLKDYILMNQDPEVMYYFPFIQMPTYTKERFPGLIKQWEAHGFGLFTSILLETGEFMGYIGFAIPKFEAAFMPCVEIGWRLNKKFWNKGLATEGAKACLDYGFSNYNFKEIYSWTATANLPSERIMQKIGMQKIGEFAHPLLDKGSWLEQHVLYHKKAPQEL